MPGDRDDRVVKKSLKRWWLPAALRTAVTDWRLSFEDEIPIQAHQIAEQIGRRGARPLDQAEQPCVAPSDC